MPSCTPGGRLKKARQRLGLTQQGVANQINQSVDAYKSWEQDRAQPRTFTMTKRVCDVLHITVDHYLGGSPNTQLQPDEIELLDNYRQLPDALQDAIRVMMSEYLEKE